VKGQDAICYRLRCDANDGIKNILMLQIVGIVGAANEGAKKWAI
jgi:hypothetical protein